MNEYFDSVILVPLNTSALKPNLLYWSFGPYLNVATSKRRTSNVRATILADLIRYRFNNRLMSLWAFCISSFCDRTLVFVWALCVSVSASCVFERLVHPFSRYLNASVHTLYRFTTPVVETQCAFLAVSSCAFFVLICTWPNVKPVTAFDRSQITGGKIVDCKSFFTSPEAVAFPIERGSDVGGGMKGDGKVNSIMYTSVWK